MKNWWLLFEEQKFERLEETISKMEPSPEKTLANRFLNLEKGNLLKLDVSPSNETDPRELVFFIKFGLDYYSPTESKKWLVELENLVKKREFAQFRPYYDFYKCKIAFEEKRIDQSEIEMESLWKKFKELSPYLMVETILLRSEILTARKREREGMDLIKWGMELFPNLPNPIEAKVKIGLAQIAFKSQQFKLAEEVAGKMKTLCEMHQLSKWLLKTSLLLSEISIIMGYTEQANAHLTTCLSLSMKYASPNEIVEIYKFLSINNLLQKRYDKATIYQRMLSKLVQNRSTTYEYLESLYIQGILMALQGFEIKEIIEKLEKKNKETNHYMTEFYCLSLKVISKKYVLEDDLLKLSRLIYTFAIPPIFLVLNLPILIVELMNQFLLTPDLTMVHLVNTISMISDLDERMKRESSIFLKIAVHLLKFRLYYLLRNTGIGNLHLDLAQNFINSFNLRFFEDIFHIYVKPENIEENHFRIDLFDFFEEDFRLIFTVEELEDGPIGFFVITNYGLEIYRKYFQKNYDMFLGGWLSGFLFLLQTLNEVELTAISIADCVFLNKKKQGLHFWLMLKNPPSELDYYKFSSFISNLEIPNITKSAVIESDLFEEISQSLQEFLKDYNFSLNSGENRQSSFNSKA